VTGFNAHWRIDSGPDRNIPPLSGFGTQAERLQCPQAETPKPANAEADARDCWKLHLVCEARHGRRHYWPTKCPGSRQRRAGSLVGSVKSFGRVGEAVKHCKPNLCKVS
jgi:hypothetical protein